jgi:hypothetical protein
MTDDERLAVEVAQFLHHVHDIAHLLVERIDALPEAEAEEFLERELVLLATLAKQFEAKRSTPAVMSSLGYKINAVIRTRVAELLKRR